jgi:hypothetical protein
MNINVAGRAYTVLKCDDGSRLSPEFSDVVLVRLCYLDIIDLITRTASKKRYLITGTPDTGKTMSIIVWVYRVSRER